MSHKRKEAYNMSIDIQQFNDENIKYRSGKDVEYSVSKDISRDVKSNTSKDKRINTINKNKKIKLTIDNKNNENIEIKPSTKDVELNTDDNANTTNKEWYSIIYEITCKKDPRKFIGTTRYKNLHKRLIQDRSFALRGYINKFYCAMREIGVENFEIHELYKVKCRSKKDSESAKLKEINKYPPELLFNTDQETMNLRHKNTIKLRTREEANIVGRNISLGVNMSRGLNRIGCVCWIKSKNAWMFSWHENSKRKVKLFSIYRYKTRENAYKSAVEFGEKMFPIFNFNLNMPKTGLITNKDMTNKDMTNKDMTNKDMTNKDMTNKDMTINGNNVLVSGGNIINGDVTKLNNDGDSKNKSIDDKCIDDKCIDDKCIDDKCIDRGIDDKIIDRGIDDKDKSIDRGIDDKDKSIDRGIDDKDKSIDRGIDDKDKSIDRGIDDKDKSIDRGIDDKNKSIDDKCIDDKNVDDKGIDDKNVDDRDKYIDDKSRKKGKVISIYRITNNKNNKILIGFTRDKLHKCLSHHRHKAKNNLSIRYKEFYNDMIKLGTYNYNIGLIHQLKNSTINEALNAQKEEISKYPKEQLYNKDIIKCNITRKSYLSFSAKWCFKYYTTMECNLGDINNVNNCKFGLPERIKYWSFTSRYLNSGFISDKFKNIIFPFINSVDKSLHISFTSSTFWLANTMVDDKRNIVRFDVKKYGYYGAKEKALGILQDSIKPFSCVIGADKFSRNVVILILAYSY